MTLSDHPRPAVAVDLAVLTIRDSELTALVIRRREPPYRGLPSLPGGFLHVDPAPGDPGEDLDEAAHRVLADKTGLPHGTAFLGQLQSSAARVAIRAAACSRWRTTRWCAPTASR